MHLFLSKENNFRAVSRCRGAEQLVLFIHVYVPDWIFFQKPLLLSLFRSPLTSPCLSNTTFSFPRKLVFYCPHDRLQLQQISTVTSWRAVSSKGGNTKFYCSAQISKNKMSVSDNQ